jgi:hypothetical protein
MHRLWMLKLGPAYDPPNFTLVAVAMPDLWHSGGAFSVTRLLNETFVPPYRIENCLEDGKSCN